MVKSLMTSLFLTLIIELTITVLMGIRTKEDIRVIICANVCTNPVVVYIVNCVSIISGKLLIYWITVAILEIFAVIVEYIIYKKYLKFNRINPFVISLMCNVISFGTGLVINYFK